MYSKKIQCNNFDIIFQADDNGIYMFFTDSDIVELDINSLSDLYRAIRTDDVSPIQANDTAIVVNMGKQCISTENITRNLNTKRNTKVHIHNITYEAMEEICNTAKEIQTYMKKEYNIQEDINGCRENKKSELPKYTIIDGTTDSYREENEEEKEKRKKIESGKTNIKDYSKEMTLSNNGKIIIRTDIRNQKMTLYFDKGNENIKNNIMLVSAYYKDFIKLTNNELTIDMSVKVGDYYIRLQYGSDIRVTNKQRKKIFQLELSEEEIENFVDELIISLGHITSECRKEEIIIYHNYIGREKEKEEEFKMYVKDGYITVTKDYIGISSINRRINIEEFKEMMRRIGMTIDIGCNGFRYETEVNGCKKDNIIIDYIISKWFRYVNIIRTVYNEGTKLFSDNIELTYAHFMILLKMIALMEASKIMKG